MAAPQIVSFLPGIDEVGTPLNQNIRVEFSVPIDIDTINEGTFILATTAKLVKGQGPGYIDFETTNLNASDLLKSPTFTGIVTGEYRLSDDRATVLFDPAASLSPMTQYVVILAGILSRTVGDVLESYTGPNTGNGRVVAHGPYTGTATDTFVLQIVEAGGLDSGTFIYWKESDPTLVSTEITLDRSILLEDGIRISFAAGAYDSGDTFSFAVTPGEALEASYTWSFTTEEGGLVDPPEQDDLPIKLESRVIEGSTRIQTSPRSANSLNVVSSTPARIATNQSLDTNQIVIEFDKELDPLSISEENVQLIMKTLPVEVDVAYKEVPLSFSVAVSGKQLIITL